MKHIVVLTGAGISAESGISTFRDAGGLWEGHDVMAVATPEGWAADRALVLKFYNDRRRQLFDVKPNAAHIALTTLEKNYKVSIITQNVDDLHERAGSRNVLHLHGELRKARSTVDYNLVYAWEKDINLGDKCEKGSQLRPHIVWFGEAVPAMEMAIDIIETADIVMVIGSSMQVYPAAGLVAYAPSTSKIYYIDPKPALNYEMKQRGNLVVMDKTATEGVAMIANLLLEKLN
jgi:NAD-dependent deacetylase